VSSGTRWEKAAEAYATGEHKTGRELQLVVEFASPRGTERVLDIGTGSGALLLALLSELPNALGTATDISGPALDVARRNAERHKLDGRCTFVNCDIADGISGPFDLIVSNPPYLNDPLQRTYRHGGGALGSELSVRIALDAKDRLTPGGSLLLYTGSPIVAGIDQLKREIEAGLSGSGFVLSYEEIGPDVFGEELETENYNHVDRIAAVVLTVQRP